MKTKLVVFFLVFLGALGFTLTRFLVENKGGASSDDQANPIATSRTVPASSTAEQDKKSALISSKDLGLHEDGFFLPQDFEKEWERTLALRHSKGLYLTTTVVSVMGDRGEGEKAFAKIFEDFGPGEDRCRLLETCFDSMTDFEQIKRCFQQLEHEDEVTAGRLGAGVFFAKQMIESGNLNLLKEADLSIFGKKKEIVISSALGRYFGEFEGASLSSAKKMEMIESVFSTGFSAEEKTEVVRKLARTIPFESWAIFSKIEGDKSDAHRALLAREMVRKDPAAALAILAATDSLATEVSAGAELWLSEDSRGAVEWFLANRDNLGAEVEKSYLATIARFSSKKNDYISAQEWANQISDESVQNRVRWEIWNEQQKKVQSEARIDPLQTVDEILSGKSNYEEKFVETAVSEWISQDSVQASEWVNAHFSGLAQSSQQYVAASFASEAAGQGDIATARQWADLIQDEKTLTRINGIIEKAEQAVSD